jgi:hypothetical protein
MALPVLTQLPSSSLNDVTRSGHATGCCLTCVVLHSRYSIAYAAHTVWLRLLKPAAIALVFVLVFTLHTG